MGAPHVHKLIFGAWREVSVPCGQKAADGQRPKPPHHNSSHGVVVRARNERADYHARFHLACGQFNGYALQFVKHSVGI